MMEEKKSILLKTYQEYHLNNEVGITEELLIEQAKDFLSSPSVHPKDRFIYLHIDFYKEVLENIASDFEKNEQSINRMKTGFNSLEKYAINLWKFPWHKEYHSIKLYTAFFKNNVEVKLQNTDAIFSILTSLGYRKTEHDQVTVKEPDIDRAIWVALDLFLVQVDLQMIKKIMERFNDSNFSLKDIVKARARTRDVKKAGKYLLEKIAKRQKLEEPQESVAASHREVKETFGGGIDATQAGVRCASAVQSTSADFKDSILSNTTEAIAMDTDDSSTGSVGKKRDPSADAPMDYKDDRIHRYNSAQYRDLSVRDLYGVGPARSHLHGAEQGRFDADNPVQYGGLSNHDLYGVDPTESHLHGASALTQTRHRHSDVTKGMMDASVGGSRSLSYSVNVTPSYFSQQYPTQDHAQFTGGDLQWINVGIQSNALRPETRVMADKSTARAPRQVQGSSGSTEGHTHFTEEGTQSGVLRPRQLQGSSGFTEGHAHFTEEGAQSGVLRPRQVQGSSGTDKYGNLREISTSSNQQSGSNELFQPVRKQETVTRPNDTSAVVGQRAMEMEQTEDHRIQNNLSSHSNGMAERAYARLNSQSGVSYLKNTLQNHLTLENGTSKEASKQSSSAIEAASSRVRTTSVAYLSGTEGTDAPQPLQSVASAGYDFSTRTADGRGYSLYKREVNGLSDELPQRGTQTTGVPNAEEVGENKHISTGSVPARFNRDQSKLDQASQKECLKEDHHSEGARNDHAYGAASSLLKKDHHSGGARSDSVYGAAASPLKKDRYSEGARNDPAYGAAALPVKKDRHSEGARAVYPCSQCLKQGELICRNCLVIICSKCQGIFTTNLCERTKGEHVFSELKRPGDKGMEREWPCSKCTLLNHPDHGVCVICGATRGISDVEQSKPGSTVCRKCTLHNEEGTKVCAACGKTLDHTETFV